MEQVKKELKQLKNRFSTRVGIHEDSNSKNEASPSFTSQTNNNGFPMEQVIPRAYESSSGAGSSSSGPTPLLPFPSVTDGTKTSRNPQVKTSSTSNEDLEYDDFLQKLGQFDIKVREYSLEEIIYQLAKELFSQGLSKSSLQDQPQHSIQRFAHFVENQAANGKIPKDLERAVLGRLDFINLLLY